MAFVNFISNRTVFSASSGMTRWILRLGVITVSLTIAVMITASSIIKGFQTEIEDKIFGFWGHVQISNLSLSNSYESQPITYRKGFIDSLFNIAEVSVQTRSGEVIRSEGGVRHIQTSAVLPGIIQTSSALEGVILKGVSEDFDTVFYSKYLRQGSPLIVGDKSIDKAVISEQTAERLGLGIGDDLRLLFVINSQQFPRKFEISGIYRTGLEEYDRKFVIVDIEEIRQLLDWRSDQIGEIEIFVDQIQDAPLIADYIYYQMLEDDLYCESIRDKYPGIFEWLELQSVNEVVILGLMLIVCILNMITTLLIFILEKTNMIGILKALGARNWTIRHLFMRSGLYILLRGLIWGNVIGLGLCALQKYTGLLKLNETDYYLDTVPISVDWVFVILINMGTALCVWACLYLPSLLINRISPIKVIQFK